MSWKDVWVTPQELVTGVDDVPCTFPTAAAARIWCRRHGIVPTKARGAHGRKIQYLKSDIRRAWAETHTTRAHAHADGESAEA